MEQQWIVESDYLHPETIHNAGFACIPFPAAPADRKYQPYRYLGRKRPFNPLWTEDSSAESLLRFGYQLTAVGYEPARSKASPPYQTGGYSEPTFAAFYPNCQSVFGFHDPEPEKLSGLEYDVIGWYSEPVMDCLNADAFRDARDAMKKAAPNAPATEVRLQALQEVFKWTADVRGDFPDRTVCYACVTIVSEKAPDPVTKEKAVKVAVGNTGTEALSAYLGNVLGDGALLEDQLEALHLSSQLVGRNLDVGLKFQEARHEKGFSFVFGGIMWTVRPASSVLPSSDASHANPPPSDMAKETLPRELGHLLNQVNVRQQAYDRAGEELKSLQKQLFADWYKYMLCTYPPDDKRDDYPDVDEVRHFIEKNDLLLIKRQMAILNACRFQCQLSLAELSSAVQNFAERTKKPYEVHSYPAPRYWLPKEPVLVIVDETVEPTKRHGQDGRLKNGLLECQILYVPNLEIEKNLNTISEEIRNYASRPADPERIGISAWTKQPWNPFALEWSVELFARRWCNNLDPDDPDYRPEFITQNYQFEGGAVDSMLKPGQLAVKKTASVYAGSSILTPHAKLQLKKRIDDFLKKLLPEYYGEKKIPVSDQTVNYFAQHRAEIVEWYTARPEEKKDAVVQTSLKVSQKLESPAFHALAQSLNGFNQALLMHKQTLQLPIADPFGFDEARAFTESVRNAVGHQYRGAPQPLDDFHPIRAGVLKILGLRLVDTFGRTQTLTLNDERVIATKAMSTPGAPHLISLPPRIVQPARLNFRWLSADAGDADEMEMNEHKSTTPVCGWLIPNKLDNSVMVYDSNGGFLGSIRPDGEWRPAFGAPQKTAQGVPISNRHLRVLINHLLAQEPPYFDHFLSALEDAQESIDPESYGQHQAVALLIGRPIAVVRATLDLEMRGRPAVNQNWTAFRLDIERDLESESDGDNKPAERDTDDITK